MSNQKNKIFKFFSKILLDVKAVFGDICYVYKNFIQWNIFKIISLFSALLVWVLCALPSFIVLVVIMFIDPINWWEAILQQSFVSQLQEVENIFWALWVFLIAGLSFLFFFIGSWYYLIYILRLSLAYVDRKKIKRTKLISLTRKQFFCFIRLSCLNFVCIFTPVFVWISIGVIASTVFGIDFPKNIFTQTLIVLVYVIIVYITYKVQFSFVIFAEQKITKTTKFEALKYIKKSISITKPKYFIKFAGVVFLYFLILLPFRSIDMYLSSEIQDLSNTYNYRNELFLELSESDRKYLEFVAADYVDMTDAQIWSQVQTYYRWRILHFLVSYILFWGLILVIVSSFYRRILLKK